MKWISTTIKRKWMDKILSGEKRVEFKGMTDFWKTRLLPLCGRGDVAINFLCGRESYKYNVLVVEGFFDDLDDGAYKDIDGVRYNEWFEITLGGRIE